MHPWAQEARAGPTYVHRPTSAQRGGDDLVERDALCGVNGEHAVEESDERR